MRSYRSFPGRLVVALVVVGWTTHFARAAEPPKLAIRVVDADGGAVAGATVGFYAGGDSRKTPGWRFYEPFAETDERGEATLAPRYAEQVLLLYARHEAKGLAGFCEVDESQFGEPVEIKLVPGCRVFGKLASSELAALKRPLEWTNVYLFVGEHRPLSSISESQEFEFFLPPGHYRLNAYGTLVDGRNVDIDVAADQPTLDLGTIDLAAEKLARLLGKTAPELQNIKGWVNTEPLALADLRGKVVVVDFWGHWCGPCVYWMPHLMALHDAYHDRGLVVIGVHDDSVADTDEMLEKLQPIRAMQWSSRQIPFALALDGGKDKEKARHGATTAAYGIHAFPTALLIDREGKLVSQFHAGSDESIAKLRELLGIEADKEHPFVPSWRLAFDAAYRLAPGQNVKRVAPPFIPERVPFITHLTIHGGNRPNTERLTVVDSGPDEPLTGSAGDTKLKSILRSLVPSGMPDAAFDCPAELANLKLPGDWVFRETASLEERLEALATMLHDELDVDVAIERKSVPRDAIVVSGRYLFHPLKAVPAHEGISFTSDPADRTVAGGGDGDFADFVGWLARTFKMHVVDETSDKPAEKITWRQRDSAIHNWQRDNPPKLDAVLKLLGEQTSLDFEKAKRDVDVWLVRRK